MLVRLEARFGRVTIWSLEEGRQLTILEAVEWQSLTWKEAQL